MIHLKLAKATYLDAYVDGFYPLHPTTAYFTATHKTFNKEDISKTYCKWLKDATRRDFLIFDDDKVIGESVINEIDVYQSCANYRIALFDPAYYDQGIGTMALKHAIDYAKNHLQLKKLALEVLSYNPRAIHLYQKLGFTIVAQDEQWLFMSLNL